MTGIIFMAFSFAVAGYILAHLRGITRHITNEQLYARRRNYGRK